MTSGSVHNEGVATFGGSTQIHQSAVGRGATVQTGTGTEPETAHKNHSVDIGVITI